MTSEKKISVLFVCLGNICRSPAAAALLHHLAEASSTADELIIDSCGLGGWHTGALPDPRMRHAAQHRGITLASRAKQFRQDYFDSFDYILAADMLVLLGLHELTSSIEQKAKIHLYTSFGTRYKGEDIPDPYHGGDAGFERVLDMLEDCCEGLLVHLNLYKP